MKLIIYIVALIYALTKTYILYKITDIPNIEWKKVDSWTKAKIATYFLSYGFFVVLSIVGICSYLEQ